MQKGNFEDNKGVFGSRQSKDSQYNDQIQKISENTMNCIPMGNYTYPC